MKNLSNLAEDLEDLFAQVKADQIDLKKAAEMNNTAGKIFRIYQIQLAYHAMRGEAPNIPYLAAGSVMTKSVSAPVDAKAEKPAKLVAAISA